MSNEQYDWVVRTSDWPPVGKFDPPFGPTLVEKMRGCGLVARFERSNKYPRRSSPEARIGTAFHHVLESLEKRPPTGSPQQVLADVIKRFQDELLAQQKLAQRQVREQGLSFSNDRVSKAQEALILAASKTGFQREAPSRTRVEVAGTDIEISVRSADGLIEGRIDRVEKTESGIRIIDYKSGMAGDHPKERYVRQIQLYAALWNDQFGEWPVEGKLLFPLSGSQHTVDVSTTECKKVLQEARATVARNLSAESPVSLAKPGEDCVWCEFRPWCQVFWDWRKDNSTVQLALGLEGSVETMNQTNGKFVIEMLSYGQRLLLFANTAQAPHLVNAHPGKRLRVLDTVIQGNNSRRAIFKERSEIFFLED